MYIVLTQYSTFYNEYFFSIIVLNIFMYVILLYNLFSLFFLFDLKYIKTLTELKGMNYLESISLFISLIFLSLSGIPPLLGFVTKFILFIYFLSKTNLAVLILFIIFNFFAMFFYLQNLRFLTAKESKYYFNIKNNAIFFDKNLINFILFFNLLNLISICFIDDLLIYFNNISSYMI